MSEIVTVDALQPGMVIVQVTRQNGPVRIRKAGLVTSTAMIQGLAEMGVQEVAIDPAQTVHIDNPDEVPLTETPPAVGSTQPASRRTHTQQLLRGEHDTRAGFDSQLSDQFNRNLFLPTVQGLPSAWQTITKQTSKYVLVVLIGLGLGVAGGSAPRWWPAWLNTTLVAGESDNTGAPAAVSNSAPAPLLDNAATGGGNKQGTSAAGDLPLALPAGSPAEATPAQPLAATPSTAGQPAAASQDVITQAANNQSGTTPLRATEQTAGETQPSASPRTQNSAEYEGKVLNAPAPVPKSAVSQALLDKFNQAVQELDEPDAQARNSSDDIAVNVSDDIPRVDELPVRLLTRLPSMKFSAHMYASDPAERWVRVNGKQRGEGDWIADEVQIVNIEGQRVILTFQGEVFSMAALTDW